MRTSILCLLLLVLGTLITSDSPSSNLAVDEFGQPLNGEGNQDPIPNTEKTKIEKINRAQPSEVDPTLDP